MNPVPKVRVVAVPISWSLSPSPLGIRDTSPPKSHTPHPQASSARAKVQECARPREKREGVRAAQAPPLPPCTTIKLRNQRLPLSGFLVTLGGTAPALPSLVSHCSLNIEFLPLPERHLELPPPISWQITPSAGRCGGRGG